jgi:hypothetical protein
MDARIADKLRKLLTLAGNNPSPEEAAAAFAKAQEMATRHRIELASLNMEDADSQMVHETIETSSTSHPGWRKVLLAGVCTPLGVFVCLRSNGRYAVAGRLGNVQTAKEIDRLTQANARGKGRAFANAYRVAAASTVSRRLAEQHATTVDAARESGVSKTALVRVNAAKDEAEDFFAQETGAKLRRSGSVRTSSAAGHSAGQRDGARINIGGNTALGRGHIALGPAN